MKLSLVLLLLTASCLDPDDPGMLVPRTVDEDATLPAIEVAGSRFHAEAHGDPSRPMLVVLHGGPGGDYRAMLPLTALADDGYYVVFWDHRGAGLSRRYDAGTYTFDGYLEDLRLVIEHYSHDAAQPIVFVARSWGAMYATWFINTYGDYGGRIRGAVLSDPGAFTRAQLDAFLARELGSADLLSEQLGDILWQDQFLTPSDHARADYLDSLGAIKGFPSEHRDPANPTPMWRSGAILRAAMLDLARRDGFDWTTHLAAFPTPVLFLRGELNTANPLEQQQQLAAAYPHAEIKTMLGVGHQMLWERPAEYLANVRTYLSSLSLRGAP